MGTRPYPLAYPHPCSLAPIQGKVGELNNLRQKLVAIIERCEREAYAPGRTLDEILDFLADNADEWAAAAWISGADLIAPELSKAVAVLRNGRTDE
jgi:hypothetical protein